MRSSSVDVRASRDCPGGILDDHELQQETLYIRARRGRIDKQKFAQRAKELEQSGECDYLKWLIDRHPPIYYGFRVPNNRK